MPFSFKDSVLAVGSESATGFAFLVKDRVFTSAVFDNLRDANTFEAFKKAIARKKRMLGREPGVIACDMHPEYISAKYAKGLFEKRKSGRPAEGKPYLLEIQHHHAHMASCMAEHGLRGRAIGVVFDGTGYGPDGNIWGGEFLAAGYGTFERMGHLEYVPMPGGDKAVSEPARMAFSHIYGAYNGNIGRLKAEALRRIGAGRCSVFAKMAKKKINSPFTSSAGRLFDAAAYLVKVKDSALRRGEGPLELERLASSERGGRGGKYAFKMARRGGKAVAVVGPMIKSIISDMKNKRPRPLIARKFHNTLASVAKEACVFARRRSGLKRVVLSGGVFQNKLLSRRTKKELEGAGFAVYEHQKISCADRGLPLGQAVIAAWRAGRVKQGD